MYPVNPKAEVVLSVPAYKSVREIKAPIDLAVLVVPPDVTLKVAEECGRKGVKGLVVITVGFREIGGVGVEREAKLQAIARKYGMRVVGPDCMGVINTEPAYASNASFSATLPPVGSVAMVSESGALGEAILVDAAQAGLGVAMFVSVGNRADVTATDLVAYWGADDQVKVVLLYLEMVQERQDFLQVAREVARKKPIIAVKPGRSDAGAMAASSHAGSIAGADIAAGTLLQQCGVLRVDNFRDMFMLAHALLHQPTPAGSRMAVVTNAGGPGIFATDAIDGLGMQMSQLSGPAQKKLRKVLPDEASVHSPVDLIASADAERYRAALKIVGRDREVDGLVVLFVSPIMIDAAAVAQSIVDETRGLDKPVLACVMGRQRSDEANQILHRAGIPVFRYPEDAAITLQLMCRRSHWLAREPEAVKQPRVQKAKAAKLLASAASEWLPAAATEAILQAYGIPLAPSRRVSYPGDAVAAAHELGYPVVLKAEADGLLHKSEHRAVRTGLRTGDEVFAAAQDLQKPLKKRFGNVTLQVQAHAEGHREVLPGMTRDPRDGPIDGRDPEEMFAGLKGAALLPTFRGAPSADLDAAYDALWRLQRLVNDFPQIAEVEVNPFILAKRGKTSAAVDGRMRVEV